MSSTNFYQSVIQGDLDEQQEEAARRSRVRRAFHLVLDKPVLVDVVKDIAPMMVGGFIYPFSDFATPLPELSQAAGYQADFRPLRSRPCCKAKGPAEAAAGQQAASTGSIWNLVREGRELKLWRQAIQAMLQQTLNVECNMRTSVESVWFDDVRTGNFDLAIGAIGVDPARPIRLLQCLVQQDRPAELLVSAMGDAKFNDRLLPQIDTEVDAKKRLALIRQARNDHGGGSSAAAGVVGKISDGRLVQLRQGATGPEGSISASTTSFGWIHSGPRQYRQVTAPFERGSRAGSNAARLFVVKSRRDKVRDGIGLKFPHASTKCRFPPQLCRGDVGVFTGGGAKISCADRGHLVRS